MGMIIPLAISGSNQAQAPGRPTLPSPAASLQGVTCRTFRFRLVTTKTRPIAD